MKKNAVIRYQDEDRRIHASMVVYWQHANGLSHCLMQAILLPNNELKVFLAELKTCPSKRGIFYDPAGAANAAWKVLEQHLGDLSKFKTDWFFRSGEFSSYDLGHYDAITYYALTQNAKGQWNYTEFDNRPLTATEEMEIKQRTNVANVECDLEKLPKLPELDPGEH